MTSFQDRRLIRHIFFFLLSWFLSRYISICRLDLSFLRSAFIDRVFFGNIGAFDSSLSVLVVNLFKSFYWGFVSVFILAVIRIFNIFLGIFVLFQTDFIGRSVFRAGNIELRFIGWSIDGFAWVGGYSLFVESKT